MIILKDRPIKERQGVFTKGSVFSRGYNSNNFKTLAAIGSWAVPHQQALADWILARPIALRHSLVNDGNIRRTGNVLSGELTTPQERNAHGPEVGWSNVGCIDSGHLFLERRGPVLRCGPDHILIGRQG